VTASDQQTHDIGLIIIGDEILSGKREDRHFAQAKAVLAKRGLALSWVRIDVWLL
jgi:molybdopterin-biosynthesis enzyme MoeA-like protein